MNTYVELILKGKSKPVVKRVRMEWAVLCLNRLHCLGYAKQVRVLFTCVFMCVLMYIYIHTRVLEAKGQPKVLLLRYCSSCFLRPNLSLPRAC